ncbi:hypothetical protein LMH73_009375 [Vibrio splendidus]|nr:hypothetical protein [Vibrio splendidus]MCC4881868.1 hypothetical protein [Vibrio splendidus]
MTHNLRSVPIQSIADMYTVSVETEMRHCAEYVSSQWGVTVDEALVFFGDVAKKASEMCEGYYHRDYKPYQTPLTQGHRTLAMLLLSGSSVMESKHFYSCPAFNDCYESKLPEFAVNSSWLATAVPTIRTIAFQGTELNTSRNSAFSVAVTKEHVEDMDCPPANALVMASLAHFTQICLINAAVKIETEVAAIMGLCASNHVAFAKRHCEELPWLHRILAESDK